MTATSPTQATDHIVQICRERSERGVATRADWERLAEINPERAYNELKTYLQLNQPQVEANPFDKSSRPQFAGAAIGFVVGVVFMAAWWLFGDYLHAEVVTTARGWDMVTFSQYVAASLLPAFAWLGWRLDTKRQETNRQESGQNTSLKDATWEDLLARFDATRRAGGTRMY
jgi:hypothetical protein